MSDIHIRIPGTVDVSPEKLKWLAEVWSAYAKADLKEKQVYDMLKLAEMLCGVDAAIPEQLNFLKDLPEEPVLKKFWKIVEKHWAELNHRKDDNELAINLNHFMSLCEEQGYTGFDRMTLIKWLPYSQRYALKEKHKTVRSQLSDKAIKCYIFKILQ